MGSGFLQAMLIQRAILDVSWLCKREGGYRSRRSGPRSSASGSVALLEARKRLSTLQHDLLGLEQRKKQYREQEAFRGPDRTNSQHSLFLSTTFLPADSISREMTCLQAPDAQPASPASLLLALAPELLLQVVSRLDFDALASFRRSSRACTAFVEAYSELIYHQLCFSQGLLEERTCAATGLRPCLYTLGSLVGAFDAEELGRAAAAQRSMSDYYGGVAEWKELGELSVSVGGRS